MLQCLEDYVTLRGLCNSAAPRSGLSINDHEAVNLGRLEQLTNPDEITISEVWAKIQERASGRFESDIRLAMSRYLTGKGIVHNGRTGYYKEPQETISASTDRRGVYIEVNKYDNIALNVVDVNLWLPATGSVTIKIHDANTGKEIYSEDFAGAEGYNSLRIDRTFSMSASTKRFAITYQDENTQSSRSYASILDSGCDCDCSCDNVIVKGCSFPSASQVIKSNASFGGETWGMIVNYNLVCSIGHFICVHLEDLKMAWFDLLAIEFLKEAEHSDRFNAFTLEYDKEEIRKILHGSEGIPSAISIYLQKVADFVENVQPDFDGVCFKCDHPVNIVSHIP